MFESRSLCVCCAVQKLWPVTVTLPHEMLVLCNFFFKLSCDHFFLLELLQLV
jgi:hypothetical protein